MKTDFDHYTRPPAADPPDFSDPVVMVALHKEAKRQLDIFYGWGVHGATVERRRIREHKEQFYVNQIAYALSRGIARVYDNRVEYWHPGEATFVLYDSTYNAYMLGFLKNFLERFSSRPEKEAPTENYV